MGTIDRRAAIYLVLYMLCGVSMSRKAELFQLHGIKKWPVADSAFEVHQVNNLFKCARLCLSNFDCTSFTTNCTSVDRSEQTECHLSNSTILYSDMLSHREHLCCGQIVKQRTATTTTTVATTALPPPTTTVATMAPPPPTTTTTTTPSPTTTTVTTTPPSPTATTTTTSATITTTSSATATTTITGASGPSVIDMVWGVRDMCFPGSQEDFMVLTDAGVYIYDTDIITPPCRGPLQLNSDDFPGYTSLPSLSEVRTLVMYQTSMLEMYTSDSVYQWQVSGGGNPLQYNNYGIQTISSFLGLSSNEDFNWGCRREYNSWERQFLQSNGRYRYITNGGSGVYNQSDDVPGMNGYDLNPWRNIPTDTVALTPYGSQKNFNFMLVNSALQVFQYTLSYSGMARSSMDLSSVGTMIFA